jgi:protein phosphatase
MIIAYKTDQGKRRGKNEDAILVDQDRGLFLLADGISRHPAGEIASELVVRKVHAYLGDRVQSLTRGDDICGLLSDAIIHADTMLKKKAEADITLRGMGTTLVAMLIKDRRAFICHVGDSRAYRLRKTIERITVDHTFQCELDDCIMIRDFFFRKNARILTQAIGVSKELTLETNRLRLQQGDILLLCSDGLTDMLSDDEIHEIIRANSEADAAVNALVCEANREGGKDNISIILVKWTGMEENGETSIKGG